MLDEKENIMCVLRIETVALTIYGTLKSFTKETLFSPDELYLAKIVRKW